jgi:hypothetical protein
MTLPAHPLKKSWTATWLGEENSHHHRAGEKKADVIEKLPHGNTADRHSSCVERRLTGSIRAGVALGG